MDTTDLYRVLQSGPYDEAGLSQVKRLLAGERTSLRRKNDLHALEQLIPLLQEWAAAAGGGWLSASALAEAADIAEIELRNTARAELLRSQAIVTGRSIPAPQSAAASEGAIDANAELLHELKTLPPGALTQSLVPEAITEEAELDEPDRRSSSMPARALSSAAPAAAAAEPRRASSIPSARSTLKMDTRIEPELRRASSVPAARSTLKMAVLNPDAPRPSVAPEHFAAQEHTEEVHTVDIELGQLPSVLPRAATNTQAADLDSEIAQAEQALEADTAPERVRELAELYAKRDAPGGREQAAELFATLGEILGNPAGIPMLERALSLVPEHAEAKALLMRYAVPRMPLSSPKITMLGVQPKAAVPQAPPPAAAIPRPPMAAGVGSGNAAFAAQGVFAAAASLPPLAAATAQRPAVSLAPRAALAPVPERVTLQGTGPANDVLALHGVPQVVSTPPAVPEIASLSPVVRSDASQLEPKPARGTLTRLIAPVGIALSAAAAFGLYVSQQHNAKPSAAAGPSAPAAASQPAAQPDVPEVAAAPEVVAEQDPQPIAAAAETPAPLKAPGPSHLPVLKLENAQLRGGKLNESQLSQVLGKAESKLLACYAEVVEKKPRVKGRVIYGFTVRTNGRASNVKRVGGTLRDEALLQCSAKVLETVRFPKPRKQSAQVKLPIHYKRT
jgi:hypothetical protein